MKCSICGKDTEHSYKIYCDADALGKQGAKLPDSNRLTGKAQTLLLRSGREIYLEYDVPVCRKCVYPSQLRFNAIAAVISGILGAVLLSALTSKLWGFIVLAFCAGNIIFGLVHFINYIKDKPQVGFAISELGNFLNKGIPSESRTVFHSFDTLKDQMGKLGELKPVDLSASDLAKLKAATPVKVAQSGNPALPTCWVFGYYDRERVQGLSVFKADFYADENIIKRVREQLHIPNMVEVKYAAPTAWSAPDITATQDSFDCNMDEIDSKVNAYLVSQTGCDTHKPKNAIKTTMLYPNAGLLLIIVNMEA